jgi:hypothetical protein
MSLWDEDFCHQLNKKGGKLCVCLAQTAKQTHNLPQLIDLREWVTPGGRRG